MVGKNIRPLKYWVQKVLPLVYDDSLSYYELLDKVIYKLNEVIRNNDELVESVNAYEIKVDELDKELRELIDGKQYEHLIEEYIGDTIKHVYFGLTNAGYFAAYIPDSWADLHFSTITDYSSELYGHLVLMYD